MSSNNPQNQAFWKKIAERSTNIQQQFWYGADKLAKYIQDNPENYLTYREYDTSKPDPNMPWWRQIFFYQGQAAINEGVTNHNTVVALKESSSWIWGMLKGDFNKNPTMSQIIVGGLVSMIPLVDQACDIRDLIANLIALSEENGKTQENYMALSLTAFGVIPEIGSAMKTIVKAVKLKGVTKKSLITLFETFESAFSALKIKSPWNKAPETWLRSKPWKKMGETALNALKKCIDRIVEGINRFLNLVGGSLKRMLEKLKQGITNVKNAIKKYIDEFCEDIQKRVQDLLPQPQLATAGGHGHNAPTNRYETNIQSGKTTNTTNQQKQHTPDEGKPPKDKDLDDPCILRPYKPDTCKPLGKTGHHVVPDRCFRLGQRTINRKPIANAITENEGLVICASKGGRNSEHNKIHQYYDQREKLLGLNGDPTFTTTLFEVESLGALSVSTIIKKCTKANLLAQLRSYHQLKGMGPDFLVRADPSGKAVVNENSVGKDYTPPTNSQPRNKKL
ncbi:hypothetical protein ASC84_06330 [Acinetobacter sp. Root1280]|uniref:hypothetical protein n=1 Tax=Acinetobacter sp. Root1280 TaxID=1736444 RepID=UPI0006F2C7B4|nr:hypothetical protein [Acinetobacter sp. Root1280]KQW98363.1 hypothetical protein ASC84_06330 [Acinetobacter sp. Root1280]